MCERADPPAGDRLGGAGQPDAGRGAGELAACLPPLPALGFLRAIRGCEGQPVRVRIRRYRCQVPNLSGRESARQRTLIRKTTKVTGGHAARPPACSNPLQPGALYRHDIVVVPRLWAMRVWK